MSGECRPCTAICFSVPSRGADKRLSATKHIPQFEPEKKEPPLCASCGQEIFGPCMTALAPNSSCAQKYHPFHFICTYCTKPLNLRGTYKEYQKKPYCHECFYRLYSGHIYEIS
ncbi:unnamed protein product [Soboliphyme baturini]|uniref:LIM zinc-binding domain-containing protein n=1 Tax=Soboliphyme baturini TaxID=241478 RepID=A0A3P8CRP4_9BILA|nr:unnamed protein product [Soboliphyme baturini]